MEAGKRSVLKGGEGRGSRGSRLWMAVRVAVMGGSRDTDEGEVSWWGGDNSEAVVVM